MIAKQRQANSCNTNRTQRVSEDREEDWEMGVTAGRELGAHQEARGDAATRFLGKGFRQCSVEGCLEGACMGSKRGSQKVLRKGL